MRVGDYVAWDTSVGRELKLITADVTSDGGGAATLSFAPAIRIGPADDDLVGFDPAPGTALTDDWMLARTGQPCDRDGAAAARGEAASERLAQLMAHRYFQRPPPKSLDRDEFRRHAEAALDGLSVEDGAALLTRFTVECVVRGADALPSRPEAWMVAGGGRHNAAQSGALNLSLPCPDREYSGTGGSRFFPCSDLR